jgi:hypothetical protein
MLQPEKMHHKLFENLQITILNLLYHISGTLEKFHNAELGIVMEDTRRFEHLK